MAVNRYFDEKKMHYDTFVILAAWTQFFSLTKALHKQGIIDN